MKSLIIVIFALIAFASGEKVRFDDHQVYALTLENENQLNAFRTIEHNSEDGYLFWNSIVIGRDVDVMVAPYRHSEFMDLVEKLNVKHELRVENVQNLVDNERPKIKPRVMDCTDYHTYEEIYSWLDNLLLAYPALLTNHLIGTSYQGRPIRALKLSYKAGNPTIFLEANIHAREWITSATATWWLNELLTSTDPEIVDLAQNIDWYIMPIFNVDGFAYTHTVNRMWRKTRMLHAHICYGTDANRNFDFNWMANGGSSSNPCSDTFAGPTPFSEPETAALAEFIAGIASEINIYLSFHSYGQYILFAYGHTYDDSPDHELLTRIGLRTGEAFGERFNATYVVGTASQALYIASGISVDWTYGVQNITVGYTFELRDRRGGSYGFILPADQIIDNALETRDGIVAMIAATRDEGYMP